MFKGLFSIAAGLLLLAFASTAMAEPMALTSSDMDQITAGARLRQANFKVNLVTVEQSSTTVGSGNVVASNTVVVTLTNPAP